MLAALGQHLNCNVVGNEVSLDQSAAESVLGFACGREADLDLLEAHFNETVPELQLFL